MVGLAALHWHCCLLWGCIVETYNFQDLPQRGGIVVGGDLLPGSPTSLALLRPTSKRSTSIEVGLHWHC